MLTKEKSEQIAQDIADINLLVSLLDVPYLKEIAKEFEKQKDTYESIGFISRKYMSEKVELHKVQLQAIQLLIQYYETVNQATALKTQIANREESRNEIDKIFL